MVIHDLSALEGRPPVYQEKIHLAFVTDRFMAVIFDFLIFSPVISFCIAGFIKQIKTYSLLDSQSNEASIIWILCVGVSAVLAVLLQAGFTFFWQATPGQRFMHLQVISFPGQPEALSFSQCLLRSIMWTVSFIFFAAPFLEVIGHPLRRAFHDRASDTLVITLKEEYDLGPLPIEHRFVSSWIRMFFLALFLMAALYTLKAYNLVQEGRFAAKASSDKNLLCSKISVENYSGVQRLDVAIAMFLADEVNSECLAKEAEYSLWNSAGDNKEWAYVAQALVSDDSIEQEKYFEQACELNKKGEVCALAQYLSEGQKINSTALRSKNFKSLTSKFLVLEDFLDQKNYLSASLLLKDLQAAGQLKEALEKRSVQIAWALHDMAKKNRQPASEDSQEIIEKFKKRYGIK